MTFADVLMVVGAVLFVGGCLLVADHIINDRGKDAHTTFGSDYYCRNHGATFEPQEIRDGDCPWCGDKVGADE
jgi:hypothetical protein